MNHAVAPAQSVKQTLRSALATHVGAGGFRFKSGKG
jgi:hypothetical protein